MTGLREDWQKTSEMSVEHGQGDPFAAAVRWSRMPMLFVDPRQLDMPIVYANDAFCKLTGYDLHEIVGRNCRFLQGPETSQDTVDRMREAIGRVQAIGVQLLNYRKDGSTFWNALFLSPVVTETGELVYYFASILDATERQQRAQAVLSDKQRLEVEVEERTRHLDDALRSLKSSLDEKTLLVHEIDHRVKNNLQTISTLISLQLRSAGEPVTRMALCTLRDRVDALGSVHRRLFNNGAVGQFDLAALVEDLAPEIVKAYGGDAVRLRMDVKPVHADSAVATPIGLILNELITNCVRHAWPDENRGSIEVSVEPGRRFARLTVEDDGVGMPEQLHFSRMSGLKLSEALVKQMRGTMESHSSRAGTRITIQFPTLSEGVG